MKVPVLKRYQGVSQVKKNADEENPVQPNLQQKALFSLSHDCSLPHIS